MKKYSLKTIAVMLLMSLLTIFILSYAGYLLYSIKVPIGRSDQELFLEVKEGESTLEIAQNLQKKELIRCPWVMVLYTRYTGINLLPGIYYFKKNMNIGEIVQRLSKGEAQEYKITIPEGWNNKQIAEYLENNDIVKKSDFLTTASDQEGYLFPDTYRIAANATSADIIKKMRDNFSKRTEGLNINKDTIVLASIVEKEAKTMEDRKLIAGIYQKRLELGMLLESCPTVLYAMNVIKEKLSLEDTKFPSPYNTYIHIGLPPGPISNPGLESIKAVLEPTKSDYFYFLSDKDSNIHYAETNALHNVNKQKHL